MDVVLAGQLRGRAGDAAGVPPDPALQPALILERLYEASGLPAFDLPRRLADLYDGSIGFPAACLYANFVSSLDGVVAGAGIAPGTISLHSEADRFVMGLLRASASTVLIGAGTLRPDPGHRWTAERVYPKAAAEFALLRASLGLAPEPPLAVVTATGRLPSLTALTPGSLVITTPVGARALAGALPAAAELVVPAARGAPQGAGSAGTSIPPADIVGVLRERGHARVLTEGGPLLFGELVAADLVDELFLTTSPALFGGAPPAVGMTGRLSPAGEARVRVDLLSLRRQGSHLFARYRLGKPPSPDDPLPPPER
ncbi:MAG TPA: dihydrofolate reductase family protein [Actinomycetota bacterium]|nr:dihydrofolate reductase family protein [Actinomycetota bacterium]